jgi:hypothetical protein
MIEALTLPTERENVILRQLTTIADDTAYFEAVEEDRAYVDQHGNVVSDKYKTIADVTRRRLEASDTLRMGIWDGDRLVGPVTASPDNDNSEIEIGYWLRKSATGNGYATLGVRAMTLYLASRYSRIFAEVHVDNTPSANVLLRANFVATEIVDRDWGRATVFDFMKTD